MTTIAIPVFGTRISGRFDCTEQIMLAVVENGQLRKSETVRLATSNPLEKIDTLLNLGVDVLICGGIPELFSRKLNNCRIEVFPWIAGEVEEVLNEYIQGKLTYKEPLEG